MTLLHVHARRVDDREPLEVHQIDRDVESHFLLVLLVGRANLANVDQGLLHVVIELGHDRAIPSFFYASGSFGRQQK